MTAAVCSEFNNLSLGMSAISAHTITETGMVRPGALDLESGTTFEVLSARVLSAAVAELLPSPGSVYLSQRLPFTLPVNTGDLLQTVIVIRDIAPDRSRALLSVECSINGVVVLSGDARVLLLAPALYWFGAPPDMVDTTQMDAVLAHDHERLARLADERTANPASANTDMVFRVCNRRRFASVFPADMRFLDAPDRNGGARRPKPGVHPHDLPALEALQRRLLGHAVETETLTFRLVHKERGTSWVEAQTRSVLDARTGLPDGYVAILRDITLRHCRDDNLQPFQTLEDVYRGDEAVTHDLNNILQSVLGTLEMASRRAASGRRQPLFAARLREPRMSTRAGEVPLVERVRPDAETRTSRPMIVLRVLDGPGIDAATLAQACAPFYMARGTVRSSTSGNQQGRILIVDDKPEHLSIASSFLEEAGLAVVRASCGDSALKILTDEMPLDALLADYSMPGLSGVGLILEAQSIRPGMPSILMTGYAASRELAALPDTIRVLPKPFHRAELLAAVGRMLASAASQRND